MTSQVCLRLTLAQREYLDNLPYGYTQGILTSLLDKVIGSGIRADDIKEGRFNLVNTANNAG